MAEEGVAWNDLWAAVKPSRTNCRGSVTSTSWPQVQAVLAKQVAEVITRELPKPAS
ncbi:hypothetical protein EMGBS6_15310 [Opitutia bacterium]|nr:hypothetical protein EMGBS6_15310 [Opitutae bacterium]